MVVIAWPAAALTGMTQDRLGLPSRCTVQAPQSAAPQPNLVPFMPRRSRRAHSSGISGGASTVCDFPLIFKVIMTLLRRSVCPPIEPRAVEPGAWDPPFGPGSSSESTCSSFQKPPHELGDLVRCGVEREMARVEEVDLGLRDVLPIGLGLGKLEGEVVLDP